MSNSISEDDKSEGTNLQTHSPVLQDLIKNIVKKGNYINYDVVIQNFNTFGNNFFGEVYKIKINGETVEGDKDINIFVKERTGKNNVKAFSLTQAYINEAFFYKEVAEIFTSLQDEANVPKEDRYKTAKAYEETGVNVVVMEDLSLKGFNIYGKLDPIPIKFAELTIQQVAKLHALSFVMEKRMPEFFNNNIKIRQHLVKYDEDWEGMMRNVCAHVAKLYDDDVKEKIEKFLPHFVKQLPKYSYDQRSVKCALLHGDFKKNNVMVRLQDGEPVEVCIIDYQFIHFGCPVMDIFCFIFTSTDREFRKKHLNDLKLLYFETLSRFLKHFDMDVEDVYPRREFEKVYAEWLDYGLMVALFVSVVAFAPDDGVDLASKPLKDLPYCPDKRYDYLFRGLIDDFIDWGYL